MARGARSVLLAAALLASAAGCAGGDAPALQTGGTPTGTAGETFTNPVYADNFPDPGVLRVGETYYAYGTNGPQPAPEDS